jgi:hypothetical protein
MVALRLGERADLVGEGEGGGEIFEGEAPGDAGRVFVEPPQGCLGEVAFRLGPRHRRDAALARHAASIGEGHVVVP